MGISAAFMVPHPPLAVPDIGRGEEHKIQDTINAYHKVAKRTRELKPETIILFSPHQVMYSDYFHISPGNGADGDFAQFRAGNVKIHADYDTGFVDYLCHILDAGSFPAGTEGERYHHLDHGTMVPLYFINQYYSNYKLVVTGLSGLPLAMHLQFGRYIAKAVKALNRRVILVASGDLSHRLKAEGPYGYQKEGPEYDAMLMDVMEKADFSRLLLFPEEFCARAGECGHRSFTIMAGALDGMDVKPERLSYEGPSGVGYGICSYEVM